MARFISKIDANLEDVYSWHQEFGATERLSPPWVGGKFLRQEKEDNKILRFLKTNNGTVLEKTEINDLNKTIIQERIKSDRQKLHVIKNFKKSEDKTVIQETISVNVFNSLIPSFLSSIIQNVYHDKLQKEFQFRKKRIENDIREHKKFKDFRRQNIAILGASEVGQQMKPFFTSGKHSVFMFVKRKPYPTAREIQLGKNISSNSLDKLKELDSIVFFASDGEDSLDSSKKMQTSFSNKIRELTYFIEACKTNNQFPKNFILISNTCVYDSDSSDVSSESDLATPHNKTAEYFLRLEEAVKTLEKRGVRVIIARTGSILSVKSGILKQSVQKQKYAFHYQSVSDNKYINWVTIDDLIYSINHLIFSYEIRGVVNICTSMPVRSDDLQIMLSSKINRPFIFKVPSLFFRLFGKGMSTDENLQEQPVFPALLRNSDFDFKFNSINEALNWELGLFNNLK